jgi:3',5'-cyclic-AMP phosphodiesterase
MRPGILALVGFMAGCLHPADERALHDERVGRAEAGGLAVEVEDGLAAVHALVPGELVLWAQAPALRVRVRAADAGSVGITIRNVLADATLEARAAGGEPLAAVLEAQTSPTTRRWRVELPAGEATLELTPPPGGAGPWRFAALADVQEAVDDVQDIFGRIAADPAVRFVVMIGDLTERGSASELRRFRDELAGLPIPMYATIGNHDIGTRDELFHEHFGRGSFRFAHRGAQLTFLDSASATIAPRVHEWLDGWLAEGRDRFHVVLLHVPLLDPAGTRNGGFASRGEAHALAGKLARGGVDLILAGHLHSYYAFETAGIPTYVSGGGGAIPDRLDGIRRHYLTIDVDPATGLFQTAVVRVD